MSNMSNARVGDYEVLGLLGAGGMGKVYKVKNVLSDRVEAMKVLLPNVGSQKDLAERFLREIKLLASLDHPNIAALRTAFTFNDQLIMIMEYVEGMTLASRIERGRIPPAEALDYIDQVLSALQYAHGRDIIHRDIKPANMMVTPAGVVKVMDFGIARSTSDHALTTAGTTLGSLYYMSPEQIKGVDVDCRSDLYSVGVSLYEMVTAQRPFQGSSEFSLMSATLKEQPKAPIELFQDLPQTLNDLVLTAIRKDPAERFQTATAFRAAVNAARSEISSAALAQGGLATAAGVSPSSATALLQDAQIGAAVGDAAAAQIPFDSVSAIPAGSQIANNPPATGHRLAYVLLGAVLVVAGLVAAGFYVPRRANIHASSVPKSESNSSAPSNAADQVVPDTPVPAVVPETSPTPGPTPSPAESSTHTADSATAARNPGSAPVIGRAKVNALQREKIGGPSPDTENSPQSATKTISDTPAGNSDELDHQMDQLSSRAAAVQSSLENLQRQQSAQGLGLRGDIVASQERMNTYLSKAQGALQTGDPTSAKKYMNLAEKEVESLESFLGR